MAIALACNPDLLFADEPTSALDPKTTDEILDLIVRLRAHAELAVLVITHDPEIIRVCDRFVSLARDTTPV